MAKIVAKYSEYLQQMGKTQDALNYYQISEQILKNLFTEVHPKTIKMKQNTALLHI